MKEQIFFNDPAIDRLMGMVMALAAEVYILRDRTQALEEILTQNGLLRPNAIEELEPTPERRAEMSAERDAFIARIMEPIIAAGRASSNVNEELVASLIKSG
jgi:hypothetical protein